MIRTALQALLLAICVFVAPLDAKGPTVRIELRSSALVGPLGIDDPRVREFDVWSGPGTSSRANGVTVVGTEGFIANWAAGATTAPTPDSPKYEVLFYAGCDEPMPGCDHPTLVYVVTYAVDAASGRGYVYIPGRTETLYAINGPSISRGPEVEGRWFEATADWDTFIRPLIAHHAAPDAASPTITDDDT